MILQNLNTDKLRQIYSPKISNHNFNTQLYKNKIFLSGSYFKAAQILWKLQTAPHSWQTWKSS